MTFSACLRHTVPRRNSGSPESTHSSLSLSNLRRLCATVTDATASPFARNLSSGSAASWPIRVVWLLDATSFGGM